MMRFCQNCGKSAGLKLFPCPKCKTVFYCGKLCMHLSWNKEHQYHCPRLSAAKARLSSKSYMASTKPRSSQDIANKEDLGDRKTLDEFKNEKMSSRSKTQNNGIERDINGWSPNSNNKNVDLTQLYHDYYATDAKGISKMVKGWKKSKKVQWDISERFAGKSSVYPQQVFLKAIGSVPNLSNIRMGNYSYI